MRTERRTLYALKPRFVAGLDGVASAVARRYVPADAVTIAAIPVIVAVGSVLVAGQSYRWLWLAVPPLCLVWMGLNAIDGSLARRTGTASDRGAVLNELVDRFGDVVVLGAGFLLVPTWVAAAALIAVSAAEIVALIGWAVHGERRLVGPMGKPDRALVIAVGAVAAAIVGGATLTVAYGIVAVGASVAIWHRVRRVWSTAHSEEREHVR